MIVLKSKYEDLKYEYNEFKSKMLNGVEISKTLKPIHTFEFPEVVLKRTQEELDLRTSEMKNLKIDFFDYMYIVKKYENVEMINKNTDVLWHNLILDTKSYMDFCLNYVGFFVHHKPYINEKTLTINENRSLLNKYTEVRSDNYVYDSYRRDNVSDGTDLLTYYMLYNSISSTDSQNYSSSKSNSESSNDIEKTSNNSSKSNFSGSSCGSSCSSSKSSCSSSSGSSSSCSSSSCSSSKSSCSSSSGSSSSCSSSSCGS